MDICSLGQSEILKISREVRSCSQSSGRYSSSSKKERLRYFNLERVEKREEEEGVVWLPGQPWIRKRERLGNDGNNGRL
jgi:hypothetical protein